MTDIDRIDSPSSGLDPAVARLRTRRERRIARRQAQILEAAEQVFASKGYHRATTREIARAADLSEGTIYNYFPSKRDLYIGLMKIRTDALVQAIANIQVDSIEDMVVELMAGQLERMRRHRHFRLFLQEARLDPELRRYLNDHVLSRISQEIEHQMRRLIDAGIMRPVNPILANWTLMGAVVGLALFDDLGAAPFLESMPAEQLASQVSDIFLLGLRAEPDDLGDDRP